MKIGEINVRAMEPSRDESQLNLWRESYWSGDLEIPHGWHGLPGRGDQVATVVAEKNGGLMGSLTGILSAVYDPFIHDPNLKSIDVVAALIKLETVLSYFAAGNGAMDVYVAIPKQLEKYIKLLEGYGWKPTCENCVILRKPLRPDHVPLLGDIRDARNKQNLTEPQAVK